MLFDAHTHVHFPAYDNDREEVLERAKEAGVKMITVGTQISTSRGAIACAEKYPDCVWATVGYHPNHLSKAWHHDANEQSDASPEVFDVGVFHELAKHPKVVGIGECGFDYYRGATSEEKEQQKEVFRAQALIAEDVGKALMIHCRPSKGTDDAYEDLLSVVTSENISIPKVVHFYVGSLAITKKLIDAGFSFTFGGVVTFARDYDEIIKFIPLNRILLETDAPYIAPASHRGKRNEPAYILETAKKIAELRGILFSDVIEATSRNTRSIFKI